ncbi:MFS transporter [Trueperella pecoris]|uniref:MFS transporter n=1 Tax=Trueperella pecoris TaxID=2733571 RepID=A0A7M1R2T6_9ACTO|nr:MFS transporter [Trueperella pecoris]QOR48498.1 MFS transporter [Trueperella pecoris]
MSNFRSSFGGYRELPSLVGYTHMVISFFGRLPTAMIIIGVLTLIVSETGSVSVAAYCSASLAIANGVGNLVIGRLTDRFGQRRPLLAIAPLNVGALVFLVWLAPHNPPLLVLVATSAVVGMTTSPIGPLSRIRWYPLASPSQLPAAMSWETVNDELIFVLGPAAVGILAAAITPGAPLLLAAGLVATCVIPFALSRYARGPANDAGEPSPSFPLVLRRVRMPLLAMVFMGMFFGAMQTTVTAFAQAHNMAGLGGLIYSALGLSAAVTALVAVALPERLSFNTRVFWGGAGLFLGAAACILATNAGALAFLLLIAGSFIGPVGVSIFTLAGRWAPRGGDGVANTAIVSANVLGVAGASAVVGQLLETSVSYGFWSAALFGVGMMIVSATIGRTDERTYG